MIHTHELASDAGPWLAQTVRLLAYESTSERPGSATVVNRMCDALFVYVIRSVLAKLPSDHASWLRAMVTPKIGDALRLIHADPRAECSVATLATKVAMSRSAFAERFAEVVGETPMQYVTRWRLYKGGEHPPRRRQRHRRDRIASRLPVERRPHEGVQALEGRDTRRVPPPARIVTSIRELEATLQTACDGSDQTLLLVDWK